MYQIYRQMSSQCFNFYFQKKSSDGQIQTKYIFREICWFVQKTRRTVHAISNAYFSVKEKTTSISHRTRLYFQHFVRDHTIT